MNSLSQKKLKQNMKELFGSDDTSSNESSKIIRTHITTAQKEAMINYIIENPELVTHSSTRDNEKQLWSDLGEKLNKMKPEKPVESWKNFWFRWRTTISSKPESDLTVLDCKLKHFLNKINESPENSLTTTNISYVNSKKKQISIEEINFSIKELEKEKYQLNLEADNNDLKILKHKNCIKILKMDNNEKRKKIKKLNEKKAYLNLKKRRYEEKKLINSQGIENKLEETFDN